jgi:DNA-binding response OmpR family regulator
MSLETLPTVLIVDDQPDIRETLAELLQGEGFRVLTASNGQEGLDLARCSPPSLVLLDLMMPIMNGWEFAGEMHRDPRLASIPLLILSGGGDLASAVLQLQARDYLEKPFNVERLLALTRLYCELPPGPARS